MPNWTEIFIFIMTLTFALGFFITKKDGFGRFNTSVLILIMVLSFTAYFVANASLGVEVYTHIAAAAVGFAGGLLRGEEPKTKSGAPKQGEADSEKSK